MQINLKNMTTKMTMMSGRRQSQKVGIRSLVAAVLCFALGMPARFQAATATATQGLTASLSPIGKVSVPASVSLTHAGTTFATYAATLSVSYKARTTPTGTGGTITMQAGSDFTPAGGPLLSAGNLTYTCSGSTLGTACTGTQTVSTSTATPVLTIPVSACTGGGGSCSGSNPNTVSINLSLVNQPAFATGTYTAPVTLTISAT
jgi:hypothetical protein